MVRIITAQTTQLADLVPLFDKYRIFYRQDSNLGGAENFLRTRLEKQESVVFIAYFKDEAVGFTQLFPSFSSVSLLPQFILNDLYVESSFRGQGIGEMLLKRAQEHCMATKCKGLALETARNNPARKLYERLGWIKDSEGFHYFWSAK